MKPKGILFRPTRPNVVSSGIAIFTSLLFFCIAALEAQQARPGAAQAAAGWTAYENGRLQDAESLLNEAVKLSPAVADYQAALAEVDSKLGQEDAAIQHFKRAIALNPVDTEFRLNLAQILQKERQRPRGAAHSSDCASSPDLIDLWHFTRGYSLFRLGSFGLSATEFKAVVQKPQFMATASFFLGNIAYSQSQFDQAEPYLAKAVELGNVEGNKAYNIYAYDYGLVLFKLGRFTEADHQFRVSIAQFDRDPLPWMFLGRCEEQLGNFPEAITMLETSINKDSTFQLSYYELARLQQRHGDPKRAAELFKKISEMKQEEVNKEEERATRLKTAPMSR